MSAEKILIDLQTDAVDKLESEDYFGTIVVRSLRKEVLASEIDERTIVTTNKGGKCGAGVRVGMPTISGENPNTPGPALIVDLPFRVYEKPTLNFSPYSGTLKTAEEIALKIVSLFHHFSIDGKGFLFADRDCMKPNTEIEGLVVYDVIARCRLPQDYPDRVVQPTLSEAGLTVTLSNNTSGATIYFTTDGTFPGSGNALATVYSAPFAVLTGTTVRWAAYKTAMVGSDVGEATIT